MRTIQTELYYFDELSEEAQEVAIENIQTTFSDVVFGYTEEEIMEEMFKDHLNFKGYYNMMPEYSLSYSQGDGVRFVGEMDLADMSDLLYRLLGENQYDMLMEADIDIELSIMRNSHRYFHEQTMSFFLTSDVDDKYEDGKNEVLNYILDEFSKALIKDARNTSLELKKMGYEYMEYCLSYENVKNYLSESSIEYYKNGRLF